MSLSGDSLRDAAEHARKLCVEFAQGKWAYIDAKYNPRVDEHVAITMLEYALLLERAADHIESSPARQTWTPPHPG